jgi:hypothetical protein
MTGGLAFSVHFAPLAPFAWLITLGAIALLLSLGTLALRRRAGVWRILCALIFIAAFANPSLNEEKREKVKDVVAVMVDRSPSQNFDRRTERTDKALASIKEKLAALSGSLETRVIEAPAAGARLSRETNLFGALDQTLADVPMTRRAGVIFLSDGQIHDVPGEANRFADYGPVHLLLSGEKKEKDRQIVILEAPAYGIVGQTVTFKYQVEDQNTGETDATVLVKQDDQPPQVQEVPINTPQELQVTISHAGENIIDIEASPLDDELTQANNRAPLIVNGVRDRLRVLLVSGQPHAGGRTWRDILTADPGVDLVHFTILREPDKLDATPQNELSLIAFPFRELFETKLYDFDLIIFDRYRLNHILPNFYFGNIAKYVHDGGALLEVSGPSYASEESIYTTELKSVLPGYPTGDILSEPYRPEVTEIGSRHPVTQGLSWKGDWGHWLRQVGVTPLPESNVLMKGAEDDPLLILNRVDKGRVAQLASDQIWLWSRGYDGGGPYAELLRRLIHWLMKEPELDENALSVMAEGDELVIRRRSLEDKDMEITVHAPDGAATAVTLKRAEDGMLEGRLEVHDLGIYTVDDGEKKRFAIVGDLNPPELRGVIATGEKMKPVVDASKGGIYWLQDGTPDIRMLGEGRDYSGAGWLGLRGNNSYMVTGVTQKPLLPAWVFAAALLALITFAWWREGKKA